MHEPTEFKVIVRPEGDHQIYVLHSMCRCGDDQCAFTATIVARDMRWNHS